MYINKCIKCGAEFETKNPKRVICPKCLYADKSVDSTDGENKQLQSFSSYSAKSSTIIVEDSLDLFLILQKDLEFIS